MSTKTHRKTKSNWTNSRPRPSARRARPGSAPRPSRNRRRATRRPVSTGWIVVGLLGAAFAVGFVVLGGRSPQGGAAGGEATDFTLASTAGGSVSLADYRGQDVLLYFNEGVGCDPCFYQTLELEKNERRLSDAGLTLLPIVMNPVAETAAELQRFGLRTPYLIDADGSVSRSYGMLGKGMHANLPGHGFVLIDETGEVLWKMEYPSMFVSADDLLAAVEPYLS